MSDPELDAMQQVSNALSRLDPEVIARVLRWASEKYKVAAARRTFSDQPGAPADGEFPDFASLHNAANPESDVDKALVAGYWLQQCQQQNEWDSQAANGELKNLGHPVGNITRALDNLMATSPRCVMQTRKSGSTKQARKKYKLTVEGITKVAHMLEKKES